jgi:predicted RNA-binding protein YlqC (UPF0109 family)
MNDHDVNIKVPQSELKSNTIIVTGPPHNVEEARKALMERLGDLELEKADREAKSYEIKVEINPEYHPKIIGRKGAVITKLREDYDVNIQLPRKDSPEENIITITGYEKNACEARDAILKIVGDFVSHNTIFMLLNYSIPGTGVFTSFPAVVLKMMILYLLFEYNETKTRPPIYR